MQKLKIQVQILYFDYIYLKMNNINIHLKK